MAYVKSICPRELWSVHLKNKACQYSVAGNSWVKNIPPPMGKKEDALRCIETTRIQYHVCDQHCCCPAKSGTYPFIMPRFIKVRIEGHQHLHLSDFHKLWTFALGVHKKAIFTLVLIMWFKVLRTLEFTLIKASYERILLYYTIVYIRCKMFVKCTGSYFV